MIHEIVIILHNKMMNILQHFYFIISSMSLFLAMEEDGIFKIDYSRIFCSRKE